MRQAVLFAVAVAIALPGLPASASLGTDDLAKFSGLLSGTVYEDQDASQSMNAGDSGIAGVTVVLYDVANDSCRSVATDGSGGYAFAVAPGDYEIYEAAGETPGALTECEPTVSTADPSAGVVTDGTIADPAGYMSTTANRIDVTVVNADMGGLDFGDFVLGASANCEETAYLFQQSPTRIFEVDLVTGVDSDTGITLGTVVNGVGFNPLDGTIWGNDVTVSKQVGTPYSLGAVSVDGGEITLPCGNCSATTFGFNGGDVTLDGYLLQWHSNTGNKNQVCWFDVNPQRTTYLQMVDSVTREPSTSCTAVTELKAADGALNPVDGLLYAARTFSGSVYQVNPVTGASHTYANVIPSPCNTSGYGAQFFDSAGFLYVSCNTTGVIHRLDVSNPPALGAPHDFDAVWFSAGPASSNNDGARCGLAAAPEIDFGDAPASYGTMLDDNGARHIVLGDGLFLGAVAPDSASDAAASADATGDNVRDVDDEDITSSAFDNYTLGDSVYDVEISVNNSTGSNAFVRGWIDWNGDGSFDGTGEMSDLVEIIDGAPSATLTWAIPANPTSGASFAR
ncbi:MAG: SdrD B-like domain-containing protein, partial [bacterium]